MDFSRGDVLFNEYNKTDNPSRQTCLVICTSVRKIKPNDDNPINCINYICSLCCRISGENTTECKWVFVKVVNPYSPDEYYVWSLKSDSCRKFPDTLDSESRLWLGFLVNTENDFLQRPNNFLWRVTKVYLSNVLSCSVRTEGFSDFWEELRSEVRKTWLYQG